MTGWELLRCPGCGHEHARPRAGRRALPCNRCAGPMEVLPLIPVAAAGGGGFGIDDARQALEHVAEQERHRAASAESEERRIVHQERVGAFETALEMINDVLAGHGEVAEAAA